MLTLDSHELVIDFWFKELEPQQWFASDTTVDQLIQKRFATLHHQLALGEGSVWRQQPLGRLAEVIVLDQFSRNLYRDSPLAFASDVVALVLAQEAVALSDDLRLTTQQRSFLYMPYMHSESLAMHEEAVRLFSQAGLENNYDFELKHKVIIERFGRYPHRNAVLGRQSTPEELAFLKQPGSSF